jgi:hypothetical protein
MHAVTAQQWVGLLGLIVAALPLSVLVWAFFSKGDENGGEPLE